MNDNGTWKWGRRLALEFELPPDPRSATEARHTLDGLGDRLPEEVIDKYRLAVTELVTNAIQHAGMSSGEHLRLVVRVSEHVLHVEVVNSGPPFGMEAQPLDPERESGRGLLLVDWSSDRWGLLRNGETRCWFEIDVQRQAEGGHGGERAAGALGRADATRPDAARRPRREGPRGIDD